MADTKPGALPRRSLLAAAAGAALHPGMTLAQTPARRPRVYDAEGMAALADYKRAVAAMLALPASDPRNWYRQALVHVIDCPHRNWWFLPWHRGYLGYFEQICAQVIGKPAFRLPYWDWTRSAAVPQGLFDLGLDPGRAPFEQDPQRLADRLRPAVLAWWPGLDAPRLDELRRRGYTTAQGVLDDVVRHLNFARGPRRQTRVAPALDARTAFAVGASNVTAALTPATFAAFASGRTANHHTRGVSGLLETGAHDNVHGGVGGFMGAFMSPVDPLFWMHHANLDRLWDVWTRRQQARGQPHLPAFADRAALTRERFLFFADRAGAFLNRTAEDCLTTAAFDYGYEPGSLDELAAAPPPRTASFTSAPTGLLSSRVGTLSPTFRRGLESAASVPVDRADFLPAVVDEDTEVVAEITLQVPADPVEVRIRVYINNPNLSRKTPVEDPHYVGTLTLFGELHHAGMAGHEGHGEPATTTLTIALGPTLRRLRQRGRLPREAIKVQLIPDSDESAAVLGGALEQVAIAIR